MQKIILLLSILTFSALFCHAQTDTTKSIQKDTVIIKPGDRFAYKERTDIRFQEIKKVLNIDKENKNLLENAETAKIFAKIFGFAGGFCVGYALGGSISGEPIDGALLAAGAGLIAVSIPISIGYRKNLRKAVWHFNSKQ